MAQHDYNIANQSGAAFRADLNNALAAIVSNNSGAAEPGTTYAYQFWADTTAGVLKQRNAANSAWVTLFQLDGEWTTIALENGTAAAPSLYFKDSGTDTGVYSPGTDQVGVATAGVQRVNFNGATEVVFNDTGADVDFRIEGDTEPNLFVVDAGTDEVRVKNLNGGPLAGARNILINGSTIIDQRNGGAALTLNNSAGFVVDRWNVNAAGGAGTGTATVQRVVDAPAGLTTSLKWTTTNAKTPAAADAFYVWQAIEGHNIDHIGFNTASAKSLTLSFWVKSSLTGTFSGFCRQQSSAPAYRSYVFTYTISSANTWEYKTVGISADPSSGFAPNVDGNSGLGILFDMGSGSNRETGTTGAWQSGDYFRSTGAVRVISTLNATWQVTGVQLETGIVATPFERRNYGQELALCQRYFARLDNASTLPVSTNLSTERGFFKLPVTMRATPNCTFAYDLGGTGATWALGPDGGYQSNAHSTITGFSVSATAEF